MEWRACGSLWKTQAKRWRNGLVCTLCHNLFLLSSFFEDELLTHVYSDERWGWPGEGCTQEASYILLVCVWNRSPSDCRLLHLALSCRPGLDGDLRTTHPATHCVCLHLSTDGVGCLVGCPRGDIWRMRAWIVCFHGWYPLCDMGVAWLVLEMSLVDIECECSKF